MNSRFLLVLAISAGFASCSSAYKTTQTPDDVYYSPERESAEYVEVKQDRAGRYSSYEYDNYNDHWLRMRVRNPYRWNAFDDYDWNSYSTWNIGWGSPYAYSWNNYWNSYWTWNSFYNPYCPNIIILNPKTNPVVYNRVRNFSLGSYTNTNYNNSNTQLFRKGTSSRLPNSGYGNYNNSNNSLGSSIRRVFKNGNSSSYDNSNSYRNSGNSSPSRSYTPSSSSSSSSSSSRSSSSGSSSGGSSSGGGSGRRGG